MMSEIMVNISSGNVLLPVRQQAITWTNADLLTILKNMILFKEIVFENNVWKLPS